ncbi:hypothetical protein LXL04_001822 [Taraxacum kok-saghyz]
MVPFILSVHIYEKKFIQKQIFIQSVLQKRKPSDKKVKQSIQIKWSQIYLTIYPLKRRELSLYLTYTQHYTCGSRSVRSLSAFKAIQFTPSTFLVTPSVPQVPITCKTINNKYQQGGSNENDYRRGERRNESRPLIPAFLMGITGSPENILNSQVKNRIKANFFSKAIRSGYAKELASRIYDQVELTLTIHQEETSEPHQWNVAIENATPFVISDTKLECKGFQSLTEIDPNVILKQCDFCIVNARRPMKPKDILQFVYASENQFPLKMQPSPLSAISLTGWLLQSEKEEVALG